MNKIINLPTNVPIKLFAEKLNLPVSAIITELMKNGILATINEQIDYETAAIIAQDLGFEAQVEKNEDDSTMTLERLLEITKEEKSQGEKFPLRPPVVTILGHVDHGKTTLLDTIRKANVAEKESGGITQHISAYQVRKKGQLITFIDTPGHEAFSAMRERGVSIADIAILVVAADDGVRPQTKEVIQYLLEKKIPTIVAINKIDKPEANLERVKKELADHGILIESWGGEVLCSEISAKKNLGIDKLLENVLLINEVENFRSDINRPALGVVLEAHLDPQKGPVATVLIKTGTLKEGLDIIAGKVYGRARRIEDFTGKKIKEAGPSTPVQIIGFHTAPNTNDILQIASSQVVARSVSSALRSNVTRAGLEQDGRKHLDIILKSDVQGSLEAIQQILGEIKSDEILVNYISLGIGNITETDVLLAENSSAVIFGFNVEITPVAKRLAEMKQVEVKNYQIIYELVEEIKKRLIAMLPPIVERTEFGTLKVLALFKTGKKDMIIGGQVIHGSLINNSLLEVKRNGEVIGHGKLQNLQQNKVNVNEVTQGYECGITFDGETKIKIGDQLTDYQEVVKKRTL